MLHLNEPKPMVTELYLDAMPNKDRVTQMLSQNARMKEYPVYPCPHAAPSLHALLCRCFVFKIEVDPDSYPADQRSARS